MGSEMCIRDSRMAASNRDWSTIRLSMSIMLLFDTVVLDIGEESIVLVSAIVAKLDLLSISDVDLFIDEAFLWTVLSELTAHNNSEEST